MGSTVSADPAALERFRTSAESIDDDLLRHLNEAADALARLAASGSEGLPDGRALPEAARALVVAHRRVSAWVGQVASAFRTADRQGLDSLAFPSVGGQSTTTDPVASALAALSALDGEDLAEATALLEGLLAREPDLAPELVRLVAGAVPVGLRDALALARPDLVGDLEGWPVQGRYVANRALVFAALSTATGERRRRLVALLERHPTTGAARQLLLFDPAGDGRVVEVFGDLEAADAVAFYVPGMSSDLDHFDARVAGRAAALRAELADRYPEREAAVVAWLGYDAPDDLPSVEVAGRSLADAGAGALARAVDGLARRRDRSVTLVSHSYGTVVAASALLAGARVDNVVFMGSPGVIVRAARDFGRDDVDLFTMEAPGDLVTNAPGFGPDPNRAGSGFDRLESGGRGHSEYLLPGAVSTANAAAVVADDDRSLQRRADNPVEVLGRPARAIDEAWQAVGERVDEWQARTEMGNPVMQPVLDPVLDVAIDVLQREVDRARPQRPALVALAVISWAGDVGRFTTG